MDGCTTANVKAMNNFIANDFIKRVSDFVDEAHYEDLERPNSADSASDVDEHRCSRV